MGLAAALERFRPCAGPSQRAEALGKQQDVTASSCLSMASLHAAAKGDVNWCTYQPFQSGHYVQLDGSLALRCTSCSQRGIHPVLEGWIGDMLC